MPSQPARAFAAPVRPGREAILARVTLFVAMLMSGGNLIIPRVPLLGLLLILALLQRAALRLLAREFANVWLLVAAIFAVAIVGSGEFTILPNLTRFANIIAGVLLLAVYANKPRDQLAWDLLPILKLMAVQAILTVPLALLFPQLFIPVQVLDGVFQSLLGIFNFHVTIDLPGAIPRPDGFFWEPGVFQIYLNLLLFISLFVFRNLKSAALGFVAAIATQSTTGIIIAVGLVGVFAFRRAQVADVRSRIPILILAPALVLPLLLVAMSAVNDKMTGDFRGSFWARQYDLVTGVRIANEHPFTGIGFDYTRYYEEANRVGYKETNLDVRSISERANSNSIFAMFASIGYPLGLIVLLGLIRQRFFRERLAVALIMLLSLMSEALLLTPFFLMFAFSGLLLARAKTRPGFARPARSVPA